MPSRLTMLERYARRIADRMRLSDWTIRVEVAELDADDNAAQINAVYGRKLAIISLPEFWEDFSPEDLRHTIVHELVHCHFAAQFSLCRSAAADGLMRRKAHEAWMPGVRQEHEYGVDAMADIIAPTMPLPRMKRSRASA